MKPAPTDQRCPEKRIAFFGRYYSLCVDQLVDDRGRAPAHLIAALIRRYWSIPLPIRLPSEDGWCSFRELRGAGPLAVNFANNTHKTITATFEGDLSALDRAAAKTAGLLEPGPGFDRQYRFYAFPEVPLILRYNAADDLLPAQACLLFRCSASLLLDIRELFTLGTYLTGCLIAA